MARTINLIEIERHRGKMTDNLKPFNILFPYVLVSALVSSIIGLIIPRGLFISGVVIILMMINRIYTKGEGKLLVLDLLYVGSIISICGMAFALIYWTCIFVPQWSSCTPNSFRAIVFALFFFPLVFGCILWIALRFPMIGRRLLKK
jgi:hypothetical protein